MGNGHRSLSFIAMLLLAQTILTGPEGWPASGQESLHLMDPGNDVLESYYVETPSNDLPQIDIRLLSTYEDRTMFHAALTLDGDVSILSGYLYSLSFWSINIVLDSGAVQVWKGGDPSKPLSGVTVEWEGREFSAVLSRSLLDMEGGPPNASAQYYTLDPLGEKRLETVLDTIEWTGTLPLNPYELDMMDPQGDVVRSTVRTRGSEEKGLDILDVRCDLSGNELSAMLSLNGPPGSSENVRYRLGINDMSFTWSSGRLEWTSGTEGGVNRAEAEVMVNALSVVAVLTEVPEPPFEVWASALEWMPGGGWLEDNAPDDILGRTELLPFGLGEAVDVSVRVIDDGSVGVAITFSGFGDPVSDMVRHRSDSNGDGLVSSTEASALFEGIRNRLSSDDRAVRPMVDGNEAVPSVTVEHQGIEGQTDRTGGMEVRWNLTIWQDVALRDGWSFSLPGWKRVVQSYGVGGRTIAVSLTVAVPRGYALDPQEVEPAVLSNHFIEGGRGISYEGSGNEGADVVSGGLSIVLVEGRSAGPDENGDEDGSGPWLPYFMISGAILVAAAVVIIWWNRRRKEGL